VPARVNRHCGRARVCCLPAELQGPRRHLFPCFLEIGQKKALRFSLEEASYYIERLFDFFPFPLGGPILRR
jgi:hypothetical protein